jgi:putative ATPase
VLKELREILSEAEEEMAKKGGQSTILFVDDEIHRITKAQQDAFLPHIRERTHHTLWGVNHTEPSFEVIPPLLSRARVMVLKPLDNNGLKRSLERQFPIKKGAWQPWN